jgi:hypothetical protein
VVVHEVRLVVHEDAHERSALRLLRRAGCFAQGIAGDAQRAGAELLRGAREPPEMPLCERTELIAPGKDVVEPVHVMQRSGSPRAKVPPHYARYVALRPDDRDVSARKRRSNMAWRVWNRRHREPAIKRRRARILWNGPGAPITPAHQADHCLRSSWAQCTSRVDRGG